MDSENNSFDWDELPEEALVLLQRLEEEDSSRISSASRGVGSRTGSSMEPAHASVAPHVQPTGSPSCYDLRANTQVATKAKT
ncbi:hypothetical protein AGABI1DRAFT_133736 [Agaricus bisporus var. burnettii JB137-S8]|uniref:Uncharacterized protein n=2 Tax=Agaricus bisporus var. burnettii TaxID=192524 RepID=K5WFH0_AGABU|nr:uncharacterized protein AGABI1DRAFT_133736 [Agaricus bisporus var. burnettii JB137-S8]EKM74016.1 hypothetical protein AGABI1DRAFT_133736 [Agaricus bisporus var. burnettii JB137-S8]KAF7762022.1 hypothetical protein Agabi119p4_10014 [Agaricus bisporus var. burnettii]